MEEKNIISPCISVCKTDPVSGYCYGCGRTNEDKVVWKNENTKEIETIEARNKPTWLPPQPFLNLGIKTRLIYERLRARSEI